MAGLTRYAPDPAYWYSDDGLPYGFSVQAPALEVDGYELDLIEQAAGARMVSDIGLHIYVSDIGGRVRLAQVAGRVAGRANGWVFVEFSRPPSMDLLRLLAEAGRCIRSDDAVYVDALATAAWIAYPGFHVVK